MLISFPEFSGQSATGIRKTELIKQHATALSKSTKENNPQLQLPVFSAIITDKRSADNVTGAPFFLQQFNRVTINTGNAFDASSGIFTAPAEGFYHFSGYFLIDDYQCWTDQFLRNPVSFDVTMVKNKTNIIEVFNFPVFYAQTITYRISSTGQEFNLLLKLQARDAIRLKVSAKKCGEGREPLFSNVIFSGFKVY